MRKHIASLPIRRTRILRQTRIASPQHRYSSPETSQIGTFTSSRSPKSRAMADTATQPVATKPVAAAPTAALPKLSPSDFRAYNRMATHMDAFHNHFRHTWNMMYSIATGSRSTNGLSARRIAQTGLGFCHQLTMHHTIEEQHIFPVLAEKMPIFQDQELLLDQHRQIHEGIEKLEDLFNDWMGTGKPEIELQKLRDIMDSFGTVLWSHLDEEVKQLGAENMRKYWTLEEMRSMPM